MKKEVIPILKLNKKSQSWYMDFLIAFFVLVIILIIFYKTLVGISATQDVLNDLNKDGVTISNLLLSSAEVGKWWELDCNNFKNLKTFGLTIDGKSNSIQEAKLKKVVECVTQDDVSYDSSRYQLGSRLEYYIYFKERETKRYDEKETPLLELYNGKYGFGNPLLTSLNAEEDVIAEVSKIALTKNIAKLSRLIHYKNKIYIMGVLLWQ